MPLALFGSRAFGGLTLFTFLLYGALAGLMLLLPYTLIQAGGYPATRAGLAVLPFPIVIASGSPMMGKLAARIGPRWPLTHRAVAGRRRLCCSALRIDQEASYWTTVLPSMLTVSLGMAIAVAPLTTAVLSSVDDHHVGTASGPQQRRLARRRADRHRPGRRRPVAHGRGLDRRPPRRGLRRRRAGPDLVADRLRDAGRRRARAKRKA